MNKQPKLAFDEDRELAAKVAHEAEQFYRSGKMHCAESVLASVQQVFAPQLSPDVLQLASGFGSGSGSGCICGAVSGGTMALGLVLGNRKVTSQATKDLHAWFKEEYGATCCKILTAHGKKGCVGLTGSVAGKVAEILLENGKEPENR